MSNSDTTSNVARGERRKHWRDRRANSERRNLVRISHMNDECRNEAPRRESDIVGTLIEGENWWSGEKNIA